MKGRWEVENIDSKDNLIRLISLYQNLVFSICLKLTGDYFAAEDLTQETFVSAYQHFDEVQEGNEKAWICRIASNKAIDYCRAAARRAVPTLEEEIQGEAVIDRNDPLHTLLNKEIFEELENCCNALPPPYDRVARAHFLEGKTAREIAKETGALKNTIQTQIYRAREMLKKSLRKEMLET